MHASWRKGVFTFFPKIQVAHSGPQEAQVFQAGFLSQAEILDVTIGTGAPWQRWD